MLVNQQHTWVICSMVRANTWKLVFNPWRIKLSITDYLLQFNTTGFDQGTLSALCFIPFYTKQGGGIGKDWNNAMSFVETKYATIVAHQDDYYEPHYAEKVLAKMEKIKMCWLGILIILKKKMAIKFLSEYKSEDQNLDVKNYESFSC